METFKSFINTPHYHLWTDALHARALAQQAKNNWDRGTYVRWAVITAWSVMEMVCRDALEDEKIGYSFKRDIDNALEKKGLNKIDWGKGIWQDVLTLAGIRKTYVHVNIPQKDLFPLAEKADWAISVIRDASKSIYHYCDKAMPFWIDDNEDRGWDQGTSVAHFKLTQAGTQNNPNAIKIAYVYKDKEHISNICLPGADYEAMINDFLKRIQLPISAVRAYQGEKLLLEIPLMIRGS